MITIVVFATFPAGCFVLDNAAHQSLEDMGAEVRVLAVVSDFVKDERVSTCNGPDPIQDFGRI